MARCKECMHHSVCNGEVGHGYSECPHYINAASVVPKSEVEKLEQDVTRLVQENEALKDTNEHLAVLLSEAKTEVAMEIFEEIGKIKKEYASGDIDDKELYLRLYMLEKKYTEQCTDCKHFVGCECFSGQTCDEYDEGETDGNS